MNTEPLPDVDLLLPPPRQSLCSWCDRQATHEIEVRPAQYTTNRHKKRVVKKPALMAACCRQCKDRIENRIAEAKDA